MKNQQRESNLQTHVLAVVASREFAFILEEEEASSLTLLPSLKCPLESTA